MSRISVGRPVSLPKAFAKADLPVPGTPKPKTARPDRLARPQGSQAEVLEVREPPSDSKRSWPR